MIKQLLTIKKDQLKLNWFMILSQNLLLQQLYKNILLPNMLEIIKN